jgi:hypothetical protein
MICRKVNYVQTVDRLVADFWASKKNDLKNEESVITVNSVKDGFHGSTRRVSQLVHLNYKYLQNLLNELLGRLEKDYSDVSPAKFQPELIRVVQTEYSRLAPKIGGWLMESMLPNHLNSFQQGLINEKEKAKNDIENKCTLWMERWNTQRKKRRRRTAKWALGIIGIPIVLAIINCFLTHYINKHLEPKDNPAVRASQIPQTPHRSSVRPSINRTKEPPAKLRIPQLHAVNEPNGGSAK